MIEFKGTMDRPVFIEMNPRPWGPLQLSIDADSGIVEAFLGESIYGDLLDSFRPRYLREEPAIYGLAGFSPAGAWGK